MTDESRQKAVGCMLFGGAVMVVGGGFLTMMLFGSAAVRMEGSGGKDASGWVMAGFGPLCILTGLAMVIGALVWGFAVNRKAANSLAMTYPGSRVLARYALMPGSEEMMFSMIDPAVEGIRFFAQLRLPDGRTPELRCPFPVFERLGEGMVGSATVQGDWIGAFVPEPRVE